MIDFRATRTSLLAIAFLAAGLTTSLAESPVPNGPAPRPVLGAMLPGATPPIPAAGPADQPLLVAAADCSGAAAEAASRTGGQVLSVSSRSQGGRTVCVVTLLIPSRDGGRPRKTTMTIPQ